MTAEKNWDDSSKAMKPDMCVSMVDSLKNEDISVQCLEIENDATPMAKLRRETEPSMKKSCDRNHTLKLFTKFNKLWELKKT